MPFQLPTCVRVTPTTFNLVQMSAWDKTSIQQMAQGVAGYQDVQRLASDVEEVVRDLRSLSPKIDSLGMTQPTKHNVRLSDSMLFSSIPLHVLKGTQNN